MCLPASLLCSGSVFLPASLTCCSNTNQGPRRWGSSKCIYTCYTHSTHITHIYQYYIPSTFYLYILHMYILRYYTFDQQLWTRGGNPFYFTYMLQRIYSYYTHFSDKPHILPILHILRILHTFDQNGKQCINADEKDIGSHPWHVNINIIHTEYIHINVRFTNSIHSLISCPCPFNVKIWNTTVVYVSTNVVVQS